MVFVTGGTGFTGAHLLYKLASQDFKVKALKRKGSDTGMVLKIFSFYTLNAREVYDKIEWVEGDILDYYFIYNIVAEAEYVYHLAAHVSFNQGAGKRNFLQVNTEGTRNIVNACLEHKVKKLCFTSSIAALGETADGSPVHEECYLHHLKNISLYSKSKYHAEMLVWSAVQEGLNAVIVNPAVIIGPGNWNKGTSSIIPYLKKHNRYYPPGVIAVVDVRDVVDCMIRLTNSAMLSERYILVSENLSFKDFFSLIADALHIRRPEKELTQWMLNLAVTFSKTTSMLKGKSPVMTRRLAQMLLSKTEYSNKKICDILRFDFIPAQQIVDDTARCYKEEKY